MSIPLPAIEFESVSKTYRRWWSRRSVEALRDVNLTVEPGTIFGLLGPNGAGKTSLVKIALTIARQNRGRVRLLGQSPDDRSVFRRVGYLPESPRFPAHLTASNVLRLYGNMSGRDTRYIREHGARWLERVGLRGWERTRVSRFSKGMVERLAFAQAVIHDPDLIFLDEPTDGLDPVGRADMRQICRELAAQGKTIFINSHILAEIETICDRVALMKSGQIIDVGTVDYFVSGHESYEIAVEWNQEVERWLNEKEFDYSRSDAMLRVVTATRCDANSLVDALRAQGIEIDSLTRQRKTLESVFLERVT